MHDPIETFIKRRTLRHCEKEKIENEFNTSSKMNRSNQNKIEN